MYTCCILICSDRSFRGERDDKTGPVLKETLERLGYDVLKVEVVPDEIDAISSKLVEWADQGVNLIVTSGGTGVGPRDVTPEATGSILEREIPGLPQAALWFSLQRSPNAALSRAKAGIRKRTLIVNLPGSPKGAVEIAEFLDKPIKHAIPIINGQVIE
ncbi:MogA/MoaB family molybdenum cofactor biosynthesis protein [Coprothermobacteraceae bacterium]|nr:MogA/MoaB family molybdenum cofactor biosynthesis protein [Coprothermobacteraceae bacterium]